MIGYRKSIEFSYNSNNELAKTLTLEDTGLTITKTTTQYHYDAFGRRIAKNSKVERLNKLNQNGQLVRYPTTLLHLSKTQKTQYQTTLMLWEGNRQLQEYTNHHIFTTVYDQDSFEPVVRVVQSRDDECKDVKIYHYHNNHLGTPQELTDENGEVVWCNYEFAWGGVYNKFYKSQSLNNIEIKDYELQPIKFQGQSLDIETGLHYNRFRYYDSDVGMFISRDPIGLLGGNNVFQYAPNPVGWVDPLGLNKTPAKDCCKKDTSFQECKDLYKKIANESVGYKKYAGQRGLKERIEELLDDKYDLYHKARYEKHTLGPLKGKGSWIGHIQQANQVKDNLKKHIIEYNVKECNKKFKNIPNQFISVSKMTIPTAPRKKL